MNGRTIKAGSNARRQNGSAIVEGVVSLCMITIGVVLFVGFLINVGFSSYYKERLGWVADQTARYASSLGGEDLNENKDKVKKFSTEMLNHMGFDGVILESDVLKN